MTLSGSFRPGAATTPQPTAASAGLASAAHLQFLTAEEKTTAALMGFFQQARLELEEFIRTGDLSVADATFYRQLLDETNRIASKVNAQGATWTSSVIPEAYSSGWRQNSSTVVPQAALEALSRDTLGLIRQTSLGMRESIRQSIAAGILQGLPSDAVRQRILQSGLTNIPHWPSVEYRAGVIARTETMRAYNAGNLDVVEANGARFVRWIASPDEAVCSICAPRNGDVFRVSDAPGPDPYPDALPLPKLPAHPRCRCTIRAEYRDPDGKVIGAAPEPPPPKLPPDAMGGKEKPLVPPARGDFEQALGKLSRGQGDRAFWRSLGKFDEDMIRSVAAFGKTNAGAHRLFGDLLSARYGIKLGTISGWNVDLRMSALRALERIRAVNPAYVVDSKYLHSLGIKPPRQTLRRNTIAAAWATGQVGMNMSLWGTFAGPKGKKLRGGDIDAAEEVLIHEFFHTIHNRYGLHDGSMVSRLGGGGTPGPFAAIEAVDRAWHEAYETIRRSSSKVAPDAGAISRLEAEREAILAKINDPERAWLKKYNEDALARVEKALAETKDALSGDTGGAEFYPTPYAQQSYAEDFAEAGMLYMLNPARLKKYSPKRYEFFRDRVMGGWEP